MLGLGLCPGPFSGLVCDLILRGGRGLSPKCALLEEYLQVDHNLGKHCLEDTRKFDALPTWARGGEGALARAVARHKVTTKLLDSLYVSNFLKIPTCGGRKSTITRLATLP